jgi:AcrR family transcriptional regulator
MELYRERGFDQTTVAEIASRADLTERTFFRYFADKREVLFGSAGALRDLLAAGVTNAPADAAPMDAVAAAIEATSPTFEERRAFARQRQALIEAHADLRERELIKLASLAEVMADALRRRGVADSAARLAAETGITIFKIAFEHWVNEAGRHDLAHHIRESLDQLKAVAAGSVAPKRERSTSRSTTPSRAKPLRQRRSR